MSQVMSHHLCQHCTCALCGDRMVVPPLEDDRLRTRWRHGEDVACEGAEARGREPHLALYITEGGVEAGRDQE